MNLIDQNLVFQENKVSGTTTHNSGWLDILKRGGNVSMIGQDRDLALFVNVEVAAVDDDNYQFQLYSNAVGADSGEDLIIDSGELAAAVLLIGTRLVFPMPESFDYQRYYKLVTTIHGSTTADITYSSRIDRLKNYPLTHQYSSVTATTL